MRAFLGAGDGVDTSSLVGSSNLSCLAFEMEYHELQALVVSILLRAVVLSSMSIEASVIEATRTSAVIGAQEEDYECNGREIIRARFSSLR